MDPVPEDHPTRDDASGLSERAHALYLRLKVVAHLIAEAPGGAGPRLLWREADGVTRSHALAGEVAIGRDRGCGLVLDHPQISRRHCRVWLEAGGEAWIGDLGSTHGTRVNGGRVVCRPLRDGDLIDLGGAALVFETQKDRRADNA